MGPPWRTLAVAGMDSFFLVRRHSRKKAFPLTARLNTTIILHPMFPEGIVFRGQWGLFLATARFLFGRIYYWCVREVMPMS